VDQNGVHGMKLDGSGGIGNAHQKRCAPVADESLVIMGRMLM